ncbi:SPOR domain-containing protein [Lentibacter sp.]|uniref:SPOR domain-containing protein n=1 Tax=Lentibacter sp. TaxID=2024994 RepID=UPI003F6A1504
MSMNRFIAPGAFFLSLFFLSLSLSTAPLSTAQAQALRDVDGPVNYPPASYKGKQFVDNDGCAFVRAGIDGRVNWIPRVSRSRKLLCGLKPTFSGAEANIASAQTAEAPVQITNNEAPAAVAPAPAPVAAPKPVAAKAKPVAPAPRVAKAAQPRVIDATPTTRPAPQRVQQARLFQPAQKPAPKPVMPVQPVAQKAKVAPLAPAAAAQSAQRKTRTTSCPNFTGISAKYAGSGKNVRCGPQSQSPLGRAQAKQQPAAQTSGQTAQIKNTGQARVMPRHANTEQTRSTVGTKIPKGYRKAWDDDRLNPNRGQMTVEGIRQSDLIWTRTIPRRLYIKDTGRVVNTLFPDLRYPYTSMADQNAAMGLTASSRSKPAKAAAPRTQAAAATPKATGNRYVQVGMFANENNAKRAAQQITAAGLPARFGTLKKGGKSYRLVMAGPFPSNQLKAAVATARRAGFSDAYAR